MNKDNFNIIKYYENTFMKFKINDVISEKINKVFDDEDLTIFMTNFYCHLRFDINKDHIIKLDNVWKWIGYPRIDPCKVILFKQFEENVDYIIIKESEENKKEYIMLTYNCFKKLCLKSKTNKIDKIHDYYIKQEKIIFDILIDHENGITIDCSKNIFT